MSYAIFDDAGNCMGMSAVERDGYEEVEFDLGVSIKKVDGTVRMMTDDELTAANTARITAAAAADNRHTRDQLLADSDWVLLRRWKEAPFPLHGRHTALLCGIFPITLIGLLWKLMTGPQSQALKSVSWSYKWHSH